MKTRVCLKYFANDCGRYSDFISNTIICGNIAATISEHLPQFMISTNTFANPPSNKCNVFERDWSTFCHEILISDYLDSLIF